MENTRMTTNKLCEWNADLLEFALEFQHIPAKENPWRMRYHEARWKSGKGSSESKEFWMGSAPREEATMLRQELHTWKKEEKGDQLEAVALSIAKPPLNPTREDFAKDAGLMRMSNEGKSCK
jgi:hypothetical protein